ncbi:MAG: DNA-directed RNA polymerase subunit omega [Syntrophobacterales bacterium RBG_19FT_COMBO_59_10]|nr:MAG: DNA-directed RNA polymerase subunit omega [Syntrophobacterales bacterium RBG_19FT_COMBO_59_10]
MARITVEDSLLMAKNRFALVLLTAQRTRQLLKGSRPLTDPRNNREIVTALREIAAGRVGYAHPDALKGVKANFISIPDDTEFIGDDEYSE